jgi:hypothetical protein
MLADLVFVMIKNKAVYYFSERKEATIMFLYDQELKEIIKGSIRLNNG